VVQTYGSGDAFRLHIKFKRLVASVMADDVGFGATKRCGQGGLGSFGGAVNAQGIAACYGCDLRLFYGGI